MYEFKSLQSSHSSVDQLFDRKIIPIKGDS